MKTMSELKISVTVIEDHDGLPFGATDQADLAKKVKEKLGADDVHITKVQQFTMEGETKE